MNYYRESLKLNKEKEPQFISSVIRNINSAMKQAKFFKINIDLACKILKKGAPLKYDETLEFIKGFHKEKGIVAARLLSCVNNTKFEFQDQSEFIQIFKPEFKKSSEIFSPVDNSSAEYGKALADHRDFFSQRMIKLLPDSETRIFNEVRQGNLEEVKAYVKRGEDIEVMNSIQMTPFHVAVISNQYEIAKYLIEQKCKTDGYFLLYLSNHVRRSTALHIRNLSQEMLNLLLEHIPIDVKDSMGYTALGNAVAGNRTKLIDFLIEHRASEELVTDSNIATCITNGGEVNALRFMAQDGRDLHILARAAAEAGSTSLMDVLINLGVNINETRKGEESLITLATEFKKPKMVEYLRQKGIKYFDYNPNAPIYIAVRKNNAPLVLEELPYYRGDCGVYADDAAEYNKPYALRVLIESFGVNPNYAHSNKKSLLNVAIRNKSFECVALLLQMGANTDILIDGKTPLDYVVAKYGIKSNLFSLLCKYNSP